MSSSITTQAFDGLAFPVARVRYSGATDTRGSRYVASIYRDRDRTFRASTPYDHAIGGGARGARAAALACMERALADTGAGGSTDDYVAIPGDFDAKTYTFTFVPREMLAPEPREIPGTPRHA